MRFRDVGNSFKIKFQKEDGSFFFGQMTIPTMSNNRTTDFAPTRRILVVDDVVDVSSGMIIKSPKGENYLTYYNGENEYTRSDQKTFGLIRVTREMSWKRLKKVIDPVTGMSKGEEYEDFGLIWAAFEADGQSVDTLNVIKKDFRILTNAQVVEGDILSDKYRASRVDNVLGITYVSV